MECETICHAAAKIMSLGDEQAMELCRICSAICEACGAECGKHDNDHCRECSRICGSGQFWILEMGNWEIFFQ
jgi:hypothetical protein